jgi:hypothetical protein
MEGTGILAVMYYRRSLKFLKEENMSIAHW